MSQTNIIYSYLAFLVLMSLLVFFAGLNETIRIESFTIGEDLLLNVTNTSSQTWTDYETFSTSYVYTNEPYITFVNFVGLLGFLYLAFYSWKLGREMPKMDLTEIFQYNILFFMLVLYILGIVFDYLINIFVDQLLIVLFSEIYYSIYTYFILVEWFLGFILFSYVLYWFSNQLKYFDEIIRP